MLAIDGAAYFQAIEVKKWAEEGEVNLIRIPAHHHKVDSIIERYQRNLVDQIRYQLYEEGRC